MKFPRSGDPFSHGGKAQAGNGKSTRPTGIIKNGWALTQQTVKMSLVKGFSLPLAMSRSAHVKTGQSPLNFPGA